MSIDSLKPIKTAFLIHSLIITSTLLAIFCILKFALRLDVVPYSSVPIIFFFLILSNVLFHAQLKVVNERMARFVNRFLITTALKLLGFLFIIVIYGFLNKEGMLPFVLVFLVVYFSFSIFEVVQIVKIQKLISK